MNKILQKLKNNIKVKHIIDDFHIVQVFGLTLDITANDLKRCTNIASDLIKHIYVVLKPVSIKQKELTKISQQWDEDIDREDLIEYLSDLDSLSMTMFIHSLFEMYNEQSAKEELNILLNSLKNRKNQ